MNQVEVRFFASAREAAGVNTKMVAPATIAEIVKNLGIGNEKLTKIMSESSYLVDETAITDLKHRVNSGSKLDVLPRFAGG